MTPERLLFLVAATSSAPPLRIHFVQSGCCSPPAHLEKTGTGQYLASSPNTWRKFLLKPRLKPFLSVPWRNTGERTASEGTETGQSDMTPDQHARTLPLLVSLWTAGLCWCAGAPPCVSRLPGSCVSKLLKALSLVSLHYGVTHHLRITHTSQSARMDTTSQCGQRTTGDGVMRESYELQRNLLHHQSKVSNARNSLWVVWLPGGICGKCEKVSY